MTRILIIVVLLCTPPAIVNAQRKSAGRPTYADPADLNWPPTFSNRTQAATCNGKELLQPPATLQDGVRIANTPPRVTVLICPDQAYPGNPWSNWGGGCFRDGKAWFAIGDHYAIGRGSGRHGRGDALVQEYDVSTGHIRTIASTARLLNLPDGHYLPGKIHSRVDLGRDGWLYYATHRGSPAAASTANHYRGDWILRTHPTTGQSEVVAAAPVADHSIPCSVLDPDRLIFYGSTAAGPDAKDQRIQFMAWDLQSGRMLYSGPNGPSRAMILAQSTGKVYYVPGSREGELHRFDPATAAPPVNLGITLGIRAATDETDGGTVFVVSSGQGSGIPTLREFNTRNESVRELGNPAVGDENDIASITSDASGEFLYYVPGAHGGGWKDGSPVVQFHVPSRTRKVIAFLHPIIEERFGLTLKGTYSTVLSADGSQLFIVWNAARGTKAWDCCAFSVITIPAAERQSARQL